MVLLLKKKKVSSCFSNFTSQIIIEKYPPKNPNNIYIIHVMYKNLNKIFFLFLFTVIFLFAACKQKHKVEILPNDEIYTCPTHVHVIHDHPAKYPEGDATHLVRRKITEEQREMLKNGNFDGAKE